MHVESDCPALAGKQGSTDGAARRAQTLLFLPSSLRKAPSHPIAAKRSNLVEVIPAGSASVSFALV